MFSSVGPADHSLFFLCVLDASWTPLELQSVVYLTRKIFLSSEIYFSSLDFLQLNRLKDHLAFVSAEDCSLVWCVSSSVNHAKAAFKQQKSNLKCFLRVRHQWHKVKVLVTFTRDERRSRSYCTFLEKHKDRSRSGGCEAGSWETVKGWMNTMCISVTHCICAHNAVSYFDVTPNTHKRWLLQCRHIWGGRYSGLCCHAGLIISKQLIYICWS